MENKANTMIPDSYDHSYNDFFNMFVNMDPSSFDHNKDLSFSSDFDQLFPLDPLPNDCGGHSSPIPTPKRSRKSPQPCSKEARCLQQETVSPAQQFGFVFHDHHRPAAISDVSRKQEAASRPSGQHGSLSASQSTPPTTPRRKKCSKGAITTPKSNRFQDTNERCDIQRKQSFSPGLTPSSQMQKGSMAYSDAWAPQFHTFGIQTPSDRLPLSPPPSDILVQHEQVPVSSAQMSGPGEGLPTQAVEMPPQYDSNIFTQSPAISMPSPSADALARHQQRYFAHMNDSALPTPKPPTPDAIFSPPHTSDPQSMSQWNSASLATSPFSFTPDFHNQDRAWWSSPMPSRVPQRQPSYQSIVPSSAPASPFENTGCQSDMSQGGLMIQFEPSFGMPTSTESSFSMQSAPAANVNLHTAPHSFTDSSSFMTPMVHNPDPRSPSLSPKSAVSPRSGQTGTPFKGHHRRNQSKKMTGLSTSAPKPATASARSSTSPKGSKASPVSFVNFTPSDSKKILTGVAPSGSSKTKARREQEARDRRRKLSEAALNAVRSAGGDVEALEAVLC